MMSEYKIANATIRTTIPGIMAIGIMLLVFSRIGSSGAVQTVMLSLSCILVLGGLVLTYIQVLRIGPVKTSAFPSSTEDLGLAVEQLSRNYEWARSQTMYAFFLSASFMGLGLVVILLGSARSVLGLAGENSSITSVAGIISEFISGTALVLYRSSSKRLNEISTRLHETWRILAAYRLARDLPEADRKEAMLPLIVALAGVKSDKPTT
jgi:TRADD-N domain-containing protein